MVFANGVCRPKGPSTRRQTPRWKSDPLVVLGAWESHVHGEAAGQSEFLQGHMLYTQRQDKDVNTTEQDSRKGQIRTRKLRFTSLAHIITPEFLKETWQLMNRKGASGVDGETTKEFESDLDGPILNIWERLKATVQGAAGTASGDTKRRGQD